MTVSDDQMPATQAPPTGSPPPQLGGNDLAGMGGADPFANLPLSMGDPAGGFPPGPGSDPSQPAQKSPLDILEEILRESKDQGGGGPAGPGQPPEPEGPVVGEDGLTDEERAAQQAEREAEKERQRQEDAAALQQQLQALKTIDQTPQYQARVAQEQAEVAADAAKDAALDGFEIFQLKHTKITPDDPPST
jgi:hypothetical protein